MRYIKLNHTIYFGLLLILSNCTSISNVSKALNEYPIVHLTNNINFMAKKTENIGTDLNCWQMPHGGVEENENLDEAVAKEMMEETGIDIKGDNTYNNMAEARMAFWEETVLPLLNNLCNKLSVWMSAQFMENIDIQYDPDSISALNSQRQILWQNLNKTHFLTDAEKRAMLGFSKK
jgi:hypothetical protein